MARVLGRPSRVTAREHVLAQLNDVGRVMAGSWSEVEVNLYGLVRVDGWFKGEYLGRQGGLMILEG